jgi:ATP synthase protein I
VKSPSPPPPERALEEGIERRRAERHRWQREGERPLAQNLAMIGALGWLIVLPTLGGIFAGQWLDRREGTGLTFTAAFLVVGLALGAGLAWQRMHSP